MPERGSPETIVMMFFFFLRLNNFNLNFLREHLCEVYCECNVAVLQQSVEVAQPSTRGSALVWKGYHAVIDELFL